MINLPLKNKSVILIVSILLIIVLGVFFSFIGKSFSSNSPTQPNGDSNNLSCSFTGPRILEGNKVGTFTSTSKGNIKSYAWSATWSPVGQGPVSGIASTFNWSGPTPGLYLISLTVSDLKDSKSCQAGVIIK